LNFYRPFYALGGSPYLWSKSEKNLILGVVSQKNLGSIEEKTQSKVIEWASFLCGLINEKEENHYNEELEKLKEEQINQGISPI
jgi:hypothetical protein